MPLLMKKNCFIDASQAWEEGDVKSAFDLFATGAQSGDESCQHNLGYFFDEGISGEVDKDKAIYWYLKSYRQGNASSANNIGLIWHSRNEIGKALWWLRRAAKMGASDALVEIARIYEAGIGIQRSASLANRYFSQALDRPNITPHSRDVAIEGIKRLMID